MESLAKGAVQFSRRYSLTEIRDRWHSLLYDPVVSAEASARMVNLELSKSSGGSKEGLGDGSSSKRKVESIRKHYNAMRKRVKRHCSQAFFDSFDLALKDEMSIEKSVIRDDDECLVGNYMEDVKVRKYDTGVSLMGGSLHQGVMNHVNNLAGCGNYSGLGEVVMSKDALWKKIEDEAASASAMRVNLSVENENNSVEARATLPHGLKGKCANDVLKASAARSGEDVGHLSDSLLNMTNQDDLIFVDIDGKDATDKPCYDNVDSLLLSSPCEIQGNDASDIRELRKLDTGTKVAMPSESWAAGLEVVANPSDGNHGDLHCSSDPGNDAQSSVAAQSPHPEHSEGFVICFFNTEDPDVPSNDNIDFSIVVPLPVTPEPQPIIKEVGCSDSSINNQRKKVPDRSSKKEDIPSHSFAASQIVGPVLVPNINSGRRPVGVVMNTENPGRNPVSAVSGQTNNININPSHSRFVPAAMMPALDGRPKQKVKCVNSYILHNLDRKLVRELIYYFLLSFIEVVCYKQEIDAPASAEVYAHPKAGKNKGLPKPEANPFSLDPEGGDDDDSDNDDDNDIPYFSDVETMVSIICCIEW